MFSLRTLAFRQTRFAFQQTRSLFTRKAHPPPLISADEAVKPILSGNRVYMHGRIQSPSPTLGIAAFPNMLAEALARRHEELEKVEINHLHVEHVNPCCKPEYSKSFFIDNYFIGANQRKPVAEGISSLIPCFLSELPKLMRSGIRRPNAAFLNVSTPDKHGFCSLGVEVATALAAAETAKYVVAQINPHVPRTHGQAFVHLNCFDAIVECNDPIPELISPKPGLVEELIGKHLAGLIPDGATLQMGIGGVPNAVLSCLTNHKNLGIHTGEQGCNILNISLKSFSPDRIVTTFIMGSKALYDYVDDNPEVVFMDVSIVNHPHVIGQNPKVTAINSAVEVDITGQVCADSVGTKMVSGVGGQVDFERGAALSKGGLPIICLPSIAKDGSSRIVSMLRPGAGVTTTRNHVHYVVTEQGIALLWGKDLVERARALIDIAHPTHREQLAKEAYERYHVLV